MHSSYADFLSRRRSDHDQAERLLDKALILDPKNADITGSYAAYFLSLGRFAEASKMAEKAKSLLSNHQSSLAAELALYSAVLACAEGRSDSPAIEELQRLLSEGFPRDDRYLCEVLLDARKYLTPEDSERYMALAAAIEAPNTTEDKGGR
jgi:tetratricopeptide (TPR) repeat protein